MRLTPNQLGEIDNRFKLAGYPKSHLFDVGHDLMRAKQYDAAVDAFKRGADNDSCVACMFYYIFIQRKFGNFHLLLPYALEGAVRGHMPCMQYLVEGCYMNSKPAVANAVSSLWMKMSIEFGNTDCTEEKRKRINKENDCFCFGCGKKEDLADKAYLICGICKFYSYCGKDCQTRHWTVGKHMNECRHVILLRKYCKPHYVEEIREAIIGGQDPKEIHTLQRLRMKLGLIRPKEDYDELMLIPARDDDNKNNTMKRGTKVKVKGLVQAYSVYNGKVGVVTKVKSIPGEGRHVEVKLLDDSDTVLNIKIDNLEMLLPLGVNNNNTRNNSSDRLNPYEYLVARKDGTMHIGSTPKMI